MAPAHGHAHEVEESTEGASPWQQLLYAAKTDSQELAATALQKVGDDVNKQDGLGCTALHYAVKGPSPEVLELLLEHDDTDVDPQDKLDGNTPLHYAVRLDHPEARNWTVKTLLEAGADPNISNKYRQKPVDLLPKDSELRRDFDQAEAEQAIAVGDLVSADDIAEDGEAGGSESD